MLNQRKLYVIVDAGVLAARGVALRHFADELQAAGVSLVQYRDKTGCPQEILAGAALLRDVFGGPAPQSQLSAHPILIMNDRADLAALAGFSGVHVGQGDLSPEDAKAVLRASDARTHGAAASLTHAIRPHEWGTQIGSMVGVSTHTEAQVAAAELSCADYVAIGPVFATGTKSDAEPVVGLAGVRRARALTTKPLVAIGGITRANARSVIEAGAGSVAVISGLFAPGESVRSVAQDFLRILAK